MSKFSIDTVIDLIEQSNQIKKFVNLNLAGKEFVSDFDIARNQTVEMLKELKAYKGAEEQGLLLRLPCPIGTKVYSIDRQIWIDEYGCRDCVYYAVDGFCDFEEEYPACTKVFETKFNFNMRDDLGKTIFLAKGEAEAALKKMQERE